MTEKTGIRYTEFLYFQNIRAEGEPSKGLVSVKKILRDFGGTFVYDKQSDALKITIKIPVTKRIE